MAEEASAEADAAAVAAARTEEAHTVAAVAAVAEEVRADKICFTE